MFINILSFYVFILGLLYIFFIKQFFYCCCDWIERDALIGQKYK